MVASLLLPVLLGIYSINELSSVDDLSFLIIVFIFAIVGNFMYGIPVSLLIDYLTSKMIKFQFLLSGFLHIIFASISFVFIGEFNTFAVICAVLFFLSEEWQMRKSNFTWRRMILNCIFVVGFAVLVVYSSFYLQEQLEKETLEYFLIPSNYEGKVTVIYNIKEEPKAKKMGDYNVIQVNDQGYALTSLPQAEGTIKNKYYFVDKNGERVKIDEKCVHIGSSGSISNDEQEFQFSNLTVKKNGCTDDFYINGNMYGEDYSLEIEEILQREGLGDFGY